MRLVVDVNNGESGIVEQIVAARIFLKTHRDCVVILCGNVEKIKKHLKKKDRFECLNSTGLIDPNVSNYLEYLRDKKSSLYVACEYVKNGHADGILSNAATSAFTIITTFVFGLIPKIKKPAFMSFIPTIKGQGFLMLDEGAQLMCSGEDLYAFAKMANTYCLNVLHKKKPIIKILNIGTEIKKGLAYHHEAYELLSKDKKLNFQGFIEGTNLLKYGADIVVSDGYSGNLALKTMEGTLSSLNQLLKKNYKKWWNILAAILSIPVIKAVKKQLSYVDNAGAFVMGINYPACKAHGNAEAKELASALRMLYDAVKLKLVAMIKNEF